MLILTWNILHRYYYEKYKKEYKNFNLEYIDEEKRLNGILKALKEILVKNKDKEAIIFLQEVPGDFINLIEINFSDQFNIYKTKFVNIPQEYNNFKYNDPGEYLVILTSKVLGEFTITDYSNEIKGYLIISNNDLYLCNIHTLVLNKYKYPIISQVFEKLKDKKFILCGDFNTREDVLKKYIYKNNKLVSNHYDHIVLSNYGQKLLNYIICSQYSDHQIVFSKINKTFLSN